MGFSVGTQHSDSMPRSGLEFADDYCNIKDGKVYTQRLRARYIQLSKSDLGILACGNVYLHPEMEKRHLILSLLRPFPKTQNFINFIHILISFFILIINVSLNRCRSCFWLVLEARQWCHVRQRRYARISQHAHLPTATYEVLLQSLNDTLLIDRWVLCSR